MIKFFLQCLHRYYVTWFKSVPIAMLHVWLIITYVYVKFGLMTPLQYVRSLSSLPECILKGTKREILSAMHVKELIQSNHSER